MPRLQFSIRWLIVAVGVSGFLAGGIELARRHRSANVMEGPGWVLPVRLRYDSVAGELYVNVEDIRKGINPPGMVWVPVPTKPFVPKPAPANPSRNVYIENARGRLIKRGSGEIQP